MKLFTPDYYVESYRAIDLERLKRPVSYTHLTLPTILRV